MTLKIFDTIFWKKKKLGKKVLIIEDNKILSDMYKFKLEIEWFQVFVANDWDIWYKLLAEINPELVLLDIMMPKMNWFEVLQKINEEWKLYPKVIVFSNLNDPKDRQKCLDLWAKEFILKTSLTPKELIQKINLYLN